MPNNEALCITVIIFNTRGVETCFSKDVKYSQCCNTLGYLVAIELNFCITFNEKKELIIISLLLNRHLYSGFF